MDRRPEGGRSGFGHNASAALLGDVHRFGKAAFVLDVKNVRKVFGDEREGGYHALEAINLRVENGEFFSLLGASGCGKTTLLNILAGFEDISGGAVTLNGRSVSGPDRTRMMLFQDANEALFPWLTVQENVEFGLRISGRPKQERLDATERYLAMVDLLQHRDKLPSQLSGGMRQRVQIARALIMEPDIVLMDEPFAALDALTRRKMHLELLRIWQETKKTVIMITHDIAEAITLSDRIAIMSTGPASRIARIIDVGMDRPRAPSAPRFGALYQEIEGLLGD
jgi:NitT/TauT family transport system ATP-binding protein